MSGPGIRTPKHREVELGFHWLQECVSMGGQAPDVEGMDTSHWDSFEGERHQNQSAFILADEASLLFDTQTPPSEERVLELIDRELPGGHLDYLAISHPEGNHAGNALAIVEAHPETTLLVPAHGVGAGPGFGAEHELFHLAEDPDDVEAADGRIKYVTAGDTVDLGRFSVEFVPPFYADHAFTTWMVECATNTLFTVDWLGFHHQESDCTKWTDEYDRPTTERDVRQFHDNVFPWIQFADPDVVAARVDELMDRYDPDRIAPAHGALIREDPARYAEMFKSAAREIAEQGTEERVRERIDATFPAEEGAD